MRGRRLTDRVEHLVGYIVRRTPADRREWGEAVLSEFAAIPPGERRLRWAMGALWFVVRRRAAAPPAVGWESRVFAVFGVVSVLPWALFSVQGIRETDAPDATMRSLVGMLMAQTVLMAAFVATWWPWRPAPALLVVALVGYAADAALGAADNGGRPLLAALMFAGPPAMAAFPILLIGALGRRPRPSGPHRNSAGSSG